MSAPTISRGAKLIRQARFFPVILLALVSAMPAAAAERRVAVFGFELIDSSLEGSMLGKNDAQESRVKRMAPMLREDIGGLDGYGIVDVSPVRAKADASNLQSCGNCALKFAEEVGADVAVIGTVQKVSNLILNINAYAFDLTSGKEIARGSADIRSNTDESWDRGLNYLFENILKKQLEAAR
ncbi:DUF3280 domain-containing protein [Jiella pacifica]|uniref:DUF2380 domain-containing protein n=1 Tax=Jiella pacifica TaxID=2696469 RepID=A0A6N9T3B9_9HYPH|nr:DUF3280 domain-containing protein [Jiella pacifica]NDW05072.1 DUF2380 domain-containing protein [Jiella pacifica]